MKIAEYKAQLEVIYLKVRSGECDMQEALRLSEKLDLLLLQATLQKEADEDSRL